MAEMCKVSFLLRMSSLSRALILAWPRVGCDLPFKESGYRSACDQRDKRLPAASKSAVGCSKRLILLSRLLQRVGSFLTTDFGVPDDRLEMYTLIPELSYHGLSIHKDFSLPNQDVPHQRRHNNCPPRMSPLTGVSDIALISQCGSVRILPKWLYFCDAMFALEMIVSIQILKGLWNSFYFTWIL